MSSTTLIDSFKDHGVDLDRIKDEATRTEVVNIVRAIDQGFEARVADATERRLQSMGLDEGTAEVLRMRLGLPRRGGRAIDKAFRKMLTVWRNNGLDPENPGKRYEYDHLVQADYRRMNEKKSGKLQRKDYIDSQFSTDQPLLIPRVVAQFVREAIEPNIVLTGLLQRITFQNGTHVTFPGMGAMRAADIPEGGEYPEQRLEFAGEVTTKIGKSGIAVKMTDEMIRYSQFDIMRMHLQAAGRALIRHKEQKAADAIVDQGVTYFDNTLGSGLSRKTTGRDSTGTYNGTFHIQDLFEMFADMGNTGFVPNTVLMNPRGWLIFARDPNLRHYGFWNQTPMFNPYNGSPGSAPQWRVGNLHQQTSVDNPAAIATTQTMPPNGFWPVPLTVVVSPYIPFDASTNTTDIILCDRNELGVLIVDEDVVSEEWDDPAHDIRKVKLRERYAIATLNQGNAIRKAKGVKVDRSYAIEDLLEWQAGTGELPTSEAAFPTDS